MPCSYTTPLGAPVLPEVNRIAATSSARVGAQGNSRQEGSRTCASVGPPQNQRRPTVTAVLTVRKACGRSTRAACASGIAMKASGAASSMQPRRFARPMPGSIRTGTAPSFKSAKVRLKNSSPGLTISTVRVPHPMPSRLKPQA